jgi:hypothetical protein
MLLACAAGHRLDPHPNLLKDDLGALCRAPVHTVSALGPLGGDLIDTTKMVHGPRESPRSYDNCSGWMRGSHSECNEESTFSPGGVERYTATDSS